MSNSRRMCRIALTFALSLAWPMAGSAVRPTPLPACSSSCSRNAPCEITFSTTNAAIPESTLFNLRVKATFTFTGAGSAETKTVAAFYFDRAAHGAGPATFKARFTPTQVGTYHYETAAAQAGLDGNVGDIQCTSALPLPGGSGTDPNRGFVRRDPASRYNYVWDDNTRIFPWGQTYYQIVNQARRTTDADATWHNAIDKANGKKMNKIRFLVSPWDELPFRDAGTTRTAETQPYCTGTQAAICEMAGGALDFTRVNLDHFVALDEVVHYLYGKGMLAEMIIFRDPGPFGAMLSSNADDNLRLLRYVIARYAAYPNVTWSLSNEWQNADPVKARWETLGNCLRSGCNDSTGRKIEADPWILDLGGTKRRPLTIHPFAMNGIGKCFEFFGSPWPSNGSLQYGRGQKTSRAGYESIACNRRTSDPGSCPGGTTTRDIPFVNDEYGYVSNVNQIQHRNLIWGIVTGGGFGSAGDSRISSAGCPSGYSSPCGEVYKSSIWADSGHYDDIANLASFLSAKSVPYWSMSPQDVCPETDGIHTLGNTTSRKFLVYFSQEGASPSAQVPAGSYSAAWLNPRTNQNSAETCRSYPAGQIAAPPPGAPACAAAPCDWVVYLTGC